MREGEGGRALTRCAACGSLVRLMCESSGLLRSARYTLPSADVTNSRFGAPFTKARAVTGAGMRGRMRVWLPARCEQTTAHHISMLLPLAASRGLLPSGGGPHAPKWSSQTSVLPSDSPNASILPLSLKQLCVMPMGSSQPLLGDRRTSSPPAPTPAFSCTSGSTTAPPAAPPAGPPLPPAAAPPLPPAAAAAPPLPGGVAGGPGGVAGGALMGGSLTPPWSAAAALGSLSLLGGRMYESTSLLQLVHHM